MVAAELKEGASSETFFSAQPQSLRAASTARAVISPIGSLRDAKELVDILLHEDDSQTVDLPVVHLAQGAREVPLNGCENTPPPAVAKSPRCREGPPVSSQ